MRKVSYKAGISKIIYGKESKTIDRVWKELEDDGWIKPVKTSVNRVDGRSWSQKNYIALPQPLLNKISDYLKKSEVKLSTSEEKKLLNYLDSLSVRKKIIKLNTDNDLKDTIDCFSTIIEQLHLFFVAMFYSYRFIDDSFAKVGQNFKEEFHFKTEIESKSYLSFPLKSLMTFGLQSRELLSKLTYINEIRRKALLYHFEITESLIMNACKADVLEGIWTKEKLIIESKKHWDDVATSKYFDKLDETTKKMFLDGCDDSNKDYEEVMEVIIEFKKHWDDVVRSNSFDTLTEKNKKIFQDERDRYNELYKEGVKVGKGSKKT